MSARIQSNELCTHPRNETFEATGVRGNTSELLGDESPGAKNTVPGSEGSRSTTFVMERKSPKNELVP